MKAISIKEPFGSLIALGLKTIESRTWKTKYRGPILICVSKGKIKDEELASICGIDVMIKMINLVKSKRLKQNYGLAVAIADLVDVRPFTPEDNNACWTNMEELDGVYAHVFENIRPIMPKVIKGKLGYWNLTKKDINNYEKYL